MLISQRKLEVIVPAILVVYRPVALAAHGGELIRCAESQACLSPVILEPAF